MSRRPLRFDQEVARPWGTMSPREIAAKYSFPMFEWRTSDHNAVIVLDAMRAVIGDLGISRKWTALDTTKAALAVHQTKGAA